MGATGLKYKGITMKELDHGYPRDGIRIARHDHIFFLYCCNEAPWHTIKDTHQTHKGCDPVENS